MTSRRHFLKQTASFSAVAPFLDLPKTFARTSASDTWTPEVHIFSKHLQFLDYAAMAQAAAEMGFAGVDLTVRPGGHVAPEQVTTALPQAVQAMQSAGLRPPMMTTAVERASNTTDRTVLETAASQGITHYRMNWYKYPENKSIPEAIAHYAQQIEALGQLNQQLGLVGCYQNHAGDRMGASVWELWQMLQSADQAHMGVQYDIRHATVEGGLSWKSGLRLIHPLIKVVVIKDFIWTKKQGRWQVQNVPLGEGMVDFAGYFRLLKQYQVRVPFCLHMEYDLGGAEHGDRTIGIKQQEVFAAMTRDLQKLQSLWQAAS